MSVVANNIVKELPNKYSNLIDKFKCVKKEIWDKDSYCYFIEPTNWKHKECINFNHSEYGWIVIDILENDVIGGVEFVDRL